jgi:hypothetical protein
MGGNPLTQGQADALKAALPGCEINYGG